MPSWYLGKIKYSQEQETGSVKQISESFLLDAVSYTDAETRLYKLVADSTPEFTVDSITRQKISDVFTYEDGDIFFKIKTAWDSVEEVKGKTKKIANSVVLNAKDISQAIERLNNEYKNMLVPYEITDINTTAILEVCRYEGKEDVTDSNAEEVDIFGNVAPVYPRFGTPIDCVCGDNVFVGNSLIFSGKEVEIVAVTPPELRIYDDSLGDIDYVIGVDPYKDDALEEDEIIHYYQQRQELKQEQEG